MSMRYGWNPSATPVPGLQPRGAASQYAGLLQSAKCLGDYAQSSGLAHLDYSQMRDLRSGFPSLGQAADQLLAHPDAAQWAADGCDGRPGWGANSRGLCASRLQALGHGQFNDRLASSSAEGTPHFGHREAASLAQLSLSRGGQPLSMGDLLDQATQTGNPDTARAARGLLTHPDQLDALMDARGRIPFKSLQARAITPRIAQASDAVASYMNRNGMRGISMAHVQQLAQVPGHDQWAFQTLANEPEAFKLIDQQDSAQLDGMAHRRNLQYTAGVPWRSQGLAA